MTLNFFGLSEGNSSMERELLVLFFLVVMNVALSKLLLGGIQRLHCQGLLVRDSWKSF